MAPPTKRGLGKGLGALIPSGGPVEPRPGSAAEENSVPLPVEGATFAELPVGEVRPNPRQPRQVFDEDALAELVFSIKEIGLLQPIVVRDVGDGYELIAGERRLRASREAGLESIPAIIRATDDEDLLRDALLENLHRANLNPLEEAAAYQQLLSDFGCTQDELARRIGRSRPQVTNTLRLLKLPPEVQLRVAAGVLSAGHARALLALDDSQAMSDLAARIVAEGLSVRAVEEVILVGDGDGRQRKRTPRARAAQSRDAALTEVVSELTARVADSLDTRVSIEGFARRNSRGKIVIECADLDDLRRIIDIID
jgi:ParB family chromosome partitioning protein